MINEDKWENSTNQNMVLFFINDQNIMFGYKSKNRKMSINWFLINVQKNSLILPVLLKEYNLFSLNTESSLEQ